MGRLALARFVVEILPEGARPASVGLPLLLVVVIPADVAPAVLPLEIVDAPEVFRLVVPEVGAEGAAPIPMSPVPSVAERSMQRDLVAR